MHITRQLISGQLSEADSELIDALQLSEKVASRVLDKKQELVSDFGATPYDYMFRSAQRSLETSNASY